MREIENESETCAKHRGEDDVFHLRCLVNLPDRGHGGEHLRREKVSESESRRVRESESQRAGESTSAQGHTTMPKIE